MQRDPIKDKVSSRCQQSQLGHLLHVSCAQRQTLKRTKNKLTIHLRNASTKRRHFNRRINKTRRPPTWLIQFWSSATLSKLQSKGILCTFELTVCFPPLFPIPSSTSHDNSFFVYVWTSFLGMIAGIKSHWWSLRNKSWMIRFPFYCFTGQLFVSSHFVFPHFKTPSCNLQLNSTTKGSFRNEQAAFTTV